MAEKMNSMCANKLLKLIEEPAEKTVFILVTENDERANNKHYTISMSNDTFKSAFRGRHKRSSYKLSMAPRPVWRKILRTKSEGSYSRALDLLSQQPEDLQFETWFIAWVRTAFQAKSNKQSINSLMAWSDEISKTGREIQKQFLDYSLRFFRQAMLFNYDAKSLVFMKLNDKTFKFEKFAPFIDASNIVEISKEIELANYHIERNANAKIVLTDLSIKLTRLLHLKKVLIFGVTLI